MKKLPSPKILPPKKTLIYGIICTIIIVPILCRYYEMPDLMIPVFWVIIIGFFVYTFLWEKKADKKNASKINDMLDNSYFASAEWREKYLSYTMEHPGEKCDPKGMRADLSKRYRKLISLPFAVMWLFFLVICLSFIFFVPDNQGIKYVLAGIIGAPASAVMLYFTLNSAKPLKRFYKRTDIDIAAVEASYSGGTIFSHKGSGINIGDTYTVIYGKNTVMAIRNSDIHSVRRHITRLKQYMNGTYAGEEYIHKAVIDADGEYYVALNEYQVETVIYMLGGAASERPVNKVDDAYKNEIVTP